MKKLELKQMEAITGGKLSAQEIKDFTGAASCIAVAAGGWVAFFGALRCIDWINSL